MAVAFDQFPASWDDRSDAIELIRSHLEAARRQARYYQPQYPHVDVEARMMTALYLAALTYRPGRMTFYAWFNWKVLGQLSIIRRTAKRRPQQPATLSAEQVDGRFYYVDPPRAE